MLPAPRSPAAWAGGRVERVSPFGMQLERARLASVAEREALGVPSDRLKPAWRTAAGANESGAARHKGCADSEAMHFCRRPCSAILYLSGHAIGPKGVRRRGDHSLV